MADRYDLARDDLARDEEKVSDQQETQKIEWNSSKNIGLKGRMVEIWPMKVRLQFDPLLSLWKITVKNDNEEEWQHVMRRIPVDGKNYRTVATTFATRKDAEDWCIEKGLIRPA